MSSFSSWSERLQSERARLLGLAYRLVGTRADAEDILQEAWLRCEGTALEAVKSPEAWLTTVVTRLCLDHLKSAKVRRESYTGVWLPEPVVTGGGEDRDRAVVAEEISLAFLLLLERLNPTERAVFVLQKVFGHRHAEIAPIVELTEEGCRQVARRASLQMAAGKVRYAAKAEAHQCLLQQFLVTVQQGDLKPLEQLLAQTVVLRSDGGGRVKAALNPVLGPNRVGRFLLGVAGQQLSRGTWQMQPVEVNGLPAMLALLDGKVSSLVALETDGERIHSVFLVLNPDKLRAIASELKLEI